MTVLSVEDFKVLIVAQFAYFLLYYAFLTRQSMTRLSVKLQVRKEIKAAQEKDAKEGVRIGLQLASWCCGYSVLRLFGDCAWHWRATHAISRCGGRNVGSRAQHTQERVNLMDMSTLRNDTRIVNHPKVIAADRAALNMLEQMVPLEVAAWAYALFVDPLYAGYGVALYVATRAFYTMFYGNAKLLVAIVTLPNYLIIITMYVSVLLKAL
eukprot:TRINITY_DN225_c0_g1_i1.p1 TRINITY_DN225_c0_g1~~TRINITY_DN225_c0_g1_i1.p1  ORF type:complete len:210 (+),score=18.48 TRINITY_DN225_c0_g1_i1:107-736(+)